MPDPLTDDEAIQQRDAALRTAKSVLVLQRREREAMRAKLQGVEDMFRQLAEQSTEGFWFVDLNPERVGYVSPAVETMFGYPAERFYEDPRLWISAIHPDDRGRVLAAWEQSTGTGWPRFQEEYRVVRPDGSVRQVLGSGTAMRNVAGAVTRLSGMIQDVTERRNLEAKVQQAQKMESVGRLAGGIAHDFNNLLTVINGLSELALERLSPGDRLRPDLEEIHRAGNRGARLTHQLLAFSRKQVLQFKILNLNTVVSQLRGMLERLLNEDIDLVVTLARDLGNVSADHGQIEQVIVNLVVNARDAMPHGGRLTMETGNVHVDQPLATASGGDVPAGPYVSVSITDTGVGMDESTRAQIFEPFFTTKGSGRGTGLGLSTVYGIVRQSGGYIAAASQVGHGSRFTIYLPQVAQIAVADDSVQAAPSMHGGETILLVEDDEGLRRLATRILRGAGYRVLAAANGHEALTVLERSDQAIHLLLTDVVMRGMSGKALAERTCEMRSALEILFMSGYTDDAIAHHGVSDEGARFLSKPFSAQQLIAKVRAVLDSKG